ncbi:DUF1553 domain-containing protein [Bremerella cremea]|uniref:DUF1553 domain-containing protein n=1 Tax=Bremerella cremea TaxID=1031537 RepID=A0A368KJD2_9BACT|nr:DUF1553 domain-containing protein [Bremerella cremea]RCS40681.1 DUF1553 domain-containing protein [Bremerella cremea]
MPYEDPIIDPLLEELLGQEQMPDLTARIMRAHQQRQAAAASQQNGAPAQNGRVKAPLSLAVNAATETISDEPAVEAPTKRSGEYKRRLKRQRLVTAIGSLSLSLCLLVMLGGVTYYTYQRFVPGQGIPLAADGTAKPSSGARNTEATSDNSPQLANHNVSPDDKGSRENGLPSVSPAMSLMPAEIETIAQVARTEKAAPSFVEPRVRDSLKLADDEVIREIDNAIATAWQAEKVKPSPAATDNEFCRRTYLQLLGRIPTVEEIESYAKHRGKNKRTWLVDEILGNEKYQAEFASFWSARFANILVGRAGGMSDDSPIDRAALENYLASAFQKNTPYNLVVKDLLTATGTTSPGSESFNPATNFLVSMIDGDAKLATAKTCSTFLGQQLQCAECHNHPTSGWDQEQFWSMNAFFRQTKLAKDRESGKLAIVDRDFVQNQASDAGEVYYEQPNGLVKVAYPAFVDGTKIPASGKIREVDRRHELAQLIVNSDDFPKATVNRMWQHFFGVGFTQPVDDMGPHNPASHPELLDNLAVHFAESGFDMKRLMRWIVLSEPYALSSRQIDANLADDPDAGQQLFARYYARQMEAEQLFHSLQMLAKNPSRNNAIIASNDDRHTWLGQINQKMGDDEDNETSSLDGGVSQSLLMMNGGLMRQATDAQAAVLKNVIASKMSPPEKVEHLFLAALSRRPTKKELNAIGEILKSRNNEAVALQDIWWALLNSNEFILDH